MKNLIRLMLLAAFAPAFAASQGETALSLPDGWCDGERIKSVRGYMRITAPALVAPEEPVAAPELPYWVGSVALPEGASNVTISVAAQWCEPEALAASVMPIVEPVPYPERPEIPKPDASSYDAAVYPASPAVLGERVYIDGAWRQNVIVTPYRVSDAGRALVRAKSITVTVSWVADSAKTTASPVTRSLRTSSVPLKASSSSYPEAMVIVSPPAFTNLWEEYIAYRRTTHPNLNIFVKNTDDIYRDYPVVENDYALSIHKYLEHAYANENVKIVLLGAGPQGNKTGAKFTNMQSLNASLIPLDTDTQIPARYPAIFIGQMCQPSDLYYACLDRLGGREVWDSDGDHVYMGSTNSYGGSIAGETNRGTIDFAPELQVMRLPLQPLIVETGNNGATYEYTAAQQMTNWVRKIKLVEGAGDRAWTGEGNNAILGANYFMEDDDAQSLEEGLRDEREFFDGGINHFSPSHTMRVVDNEWEVRTRNHQFFSGMRANNITRVHVGYHWALPDPYGGDWTGDEALTNTAATLPIVYSEDFDAAIVQSHGWARGADPIYAPTLMRQEITGVTPILYCPLPCESGWMDYTVGGQNITNATCVGAAACLAPGGFAASYNNTRVGYWNGFGNTYSSLLEGYLLEAMYVGKCGHDFTFDPDNNDSALNPVSAGKALLMARQKLGASGGSVLFGKFNGWCIVGLNGYGDPLVTVTPQVDATDDFSRVVYRVLTLSENPTVATTNSAARLIVGGGVNRLATNGEGILRATVDAKIAASELAWEVAGGVGRNLSFDSPGGRLVLPGSERRYFGRTFANVNEVAVTGENVTLDFGFNRENETLPLSSLSFNSETGGTNVLRNARLDVSTAFTDVTIPVSNSTLRCELTSAASFSLTDAELNIVTNPMWLAVAWDKPIALNNSRVVASLPDLTFKGITLSATGGASSLTNAVAGAPLKVEGDLTVNLSSGATLSIDCALLNANGANSRLVVNGSGTIALNGLPLVGFTALEVGAGVTLALPATEAESIRILTGGASANVTFANNATVLVGGEALTTNYGFMGGTFFRDTSAMCVPPYSRTLGGADESWFNSSGWFDGNGLPFGSTWANAALVAGSAVNLSVGSSASDAETVTLAVECDVEMSTLTIDGSASASALAIMPVNGAKVTANNINISSLYSPLTIGFDVDSQAHPISFTPKSDLTLAGRGGYGTLTVNSGRTVTLNRGWFGTISNSGTLVCSGANAADWVGISLPRTGQNVTVAAPITVAGEYKTPTVFNAIGPNCNFVSGSFTVNPNTVFSMSDGAKVTFNGNLWVNGNYSMSQIVISDGAELTINGNIVANNNNPAPGGSIYNPLWDISGEGTMVRAVLLDNGRFGDSTYPARVSLSDGGALVIGSGGVNGSFTSSRYEITSSDGVLGADADWTVTSAATMPITIPYGKTHIFDPMGHTITYPCKITGTGTLVVTNSANATGTLVLSGTGNDWSGGTRLLGGTTRITTATALPMTGTVYIGKDAVLDLGTVRPTGVTFDSASTGRLAFTLTDDEAMWGMYGVSLGKVEGDAVPASLDYFCMGASGGIYEGYFTVQNGNLKFFKTTSITPPISAIVTGEQNWTEVVWKDSHDVTQNLAPNRLAAFDELFVSAGENDAKLVLDTETLPPTVVLEGANRLEIDIGELAEDALPNLIVSEGATAEFFESVPFPAEKLSNLGAVRFMSETNIQFTADSFIAGTNRWQRGYFVGIEDETGLDTLLVAEDDEVSMLEDAKSENRHAMGFTVTGGNLSFQNAAGAVWLGHLGASSAFTQTGGTVEFNVHDASASDVGRNSRGVLFGWTGAGKNNTYAVSILGGTFSVPNAHLNYWEAGTTLTVGNGGMGNGEWGIVKVRGIVAHADTSANKVIVNEGGILELGDTGIQARNLTLTLANGTIRATAGSAIAAPIAFNGGTLAAAAGARLDVSKGFSSANGELSIGAEGWDGTVAIGELRHLNVALSSASCGTLELELTAEETAAQSAELFSCTELPQALTIVGYDPDGNKWKGTTEVSGGHLKFTLTEIIPDVLDIPAGTRYDLSALGVSRPTIVTGGGEAVSVGALPSANFNFTNDLWTGTVVISNFSQNNWDPIAWRVYGNRIQLSAFAGYPKNANVTNLCELVLVDSEDGNPAFLMTDGYSDVSCVFGALSGTGSFKQTKGILQGFNFPNASNFFGVFDLVGCNITIGSKIRHRYKDAGPAGSIFLDPDGSLGLKPGMEWSASGGITLNGPMNLVADISSLYDGLVILTNKTGVLSLGKSALLTVDGRTTGWKLTTVGKSVVLSAGATIPFDVFDGSYTTQLAVPTNWIASHVDADYDVSSAEGIAAIAAKLNEKGGNGCLYWESYVLGLDPETEEFTIETFDFDPATGKFSVKGSWDRSGAPSGTGITPTLVLEAADDLSFKNPTRTNPDASNIFEVEKGAGDSKFYRLRVIFSSAE